ncbi:DUF6705 family protein [Psychroserpens sp. AS72]|uniref:DUF6705 family protein n=1 Tax=Psychroserpens sp. AS72 TaxID=3135775 RepID=UPI0031812EC8
MKKLLIISIFTIAFTCKAQSPIFPLEDWDKEQSNAYYKDLDNELDTFVGTWLYTNGNTSWKIKLKKEITFFNDKYYEDLIVGEYQYIANGIQIINTLPNIDTVNGYLHEITGNSIYKNCDYLPPSDCIPGESRLITSLSDPLTGHAATVILSKRIVDGLETIIAYVIFEQLSSYNGYSLPKPEPTMPWQKEYTLIKQ